MRKVCGCVLALCLGAAAVPALADEVILNAEIIPSGASVTSIAIKSDALAPTTVDASFTFEKTVTSGFGESATKEVVSQPVYTATWTPDGSVVLTTDAFATNSKFTITYAIPAEEGKEEQVLGTWSQEDVSDVKYAVIDQFITDTYTGTYKDAEGKDVELTITYRLYIPENAEGAPMVVTMHGSGESGSDGVAHVVNNEIAECWADPTWQAEHPCYVFAPQWPKADVSNDLELRDSYLAVYHDMFADMIAKYQPSKTYLATLSMGSRLGFRYLNLYPDEFDAALMCCGALQNADLSGVKDKPIWLVHAASDFVNKAQNSMDAYNQLVAAGNENVKLTIVSDDGMYGVISHGVWQFVYGNEEYMNWLFEQ